MGELGDPCRLRGNPGVHLENAQEAFARKCSESNPGRGPSRGRKPEGISRARSTGRERHEAQGPWTDFKGELLNAELGDGLWRTVIFQRCPRAAAEGRWEQRRREQGGINWSRTMASGVAVCFPARTLTKGLSFLSLLQCLQHGGPGA